MRLNGLDLNLLVALDVLLAERSIVRSAARLGLTASAVSHALARLRDHFGDALIEFRGGHADLTPRAIALETPLRDLLAQLRRMVTDTPDFDPAASRRSLRIMLSDYALAVGVAGALAAIVRAAPGISLECFAPEAPGEQLERGSIDIAILPRTHVSTDHPVIPLFEDRYAVLVCAAGRFAEGIDTAAYFAADHVALRFGAAIAAPAGLPQARRIAVSVPSFAALAGLLAGTDLVATVPLRLARHLSLGQPLRIVPLPFAAAPIDEVAQVRRTSLEDPAIMWAVEHFRS
jgi:LysR family transcriptional regulator, nod-box dependent transcriptional activator